METLQWIVAAIDLKTTSDYLIVSLALFFFNIIQFVDEVTAYKNAGRIVLSDELNQQLFRWTAISKQSRQSWQLNDDQKMKQKDDSSTTAQSVSGQLFSEPQSSRTVLNRCHFVGSECRLDLRQCLINRRAN